MPETDDLRHAQCLRAAQALRELAFPPDGLLVDPKPRMRNVPAMVNDFQIDWKWAPGVANARHLADPDRSTFYLSFTNGIAIRAPLSSVRIGVDAAPGALKT